HKMSLFAVPGPVTDWAPYFVSRTISAFLQPRPSCRTAARASRSDGWRPPWRLSAPRSPMLPKHVALGGPEPPCATGTRFGRLISIFIFLGEYCRFAFFSFD